MNTRVRTLALLLLLFAVAALWYTRSAVKNQRAQPRGAPASPSNESKQKKSPEREPVTLEGVRASYRLKPDTRFVLAFEQVDRFLGRNISRPVSFRNEGDRWVFELPNLDPVSVALLPDFEELMNLLVRYAGSALSTAAISLSEEMPEKRGMVETLFRSGTPVEALQEMDKAWAVQPGAYLLSEAARSLALLNLQQIESVGAGTLIPSRALACLALARAANNSPQLEAESLLAQAMGYTTHATRVAALLPADTAVRMYVLRQDRGLKHLADAKASVGLTRYLYIRRLADLGKAEEWLEAASASFPDFIPALPIIQSAIATGDFDHTREFGTRLPFEVLQELSRVTGKNAENANTPGKQIQALNSLLPQVHGSGPFADSELVREYYSSTFYSGLLTTGLFYYGSLSSVEATNEFAAMLGSPTEEMGKEFAQWFNHLAEFKSGKKAWNDLFKDIGGFPLLGTRPRHFTMVQMLRKIPYQSTARIQAIQQHAARLDTRPRERILLARLMYQELGDLPSTERLFGSFQSCCRDSDQEQSVWFLKYMGQAQSVLESSEIDEKAKVDILYYLTTEAQPSEEKIVRAYKILYSQFPENFYVSRYYANYLKDSGRLEQAEEVLLLWLKKHSYARDGFDYIHTAVQIAEIYRQHGRYKESLAWVQPVASSWQQSALGETALTLDRLGKQKEAMEMAQLLVQRYPFSGWSIGVVLQLHWENGRYREAAATVQDQRYTISDQDWCYTVGKQFADVFTGKPNTEGLHALAELTSIPRHKYNLYCFAKFVNQKGNHDLAFEMMRLLARKKLAWIPDLVHAYEFLSAGRDREEALEWISKEVPANKHDDFARNAFAAGTYDLLWEVARPDSKSKNPEYVWLLRAASSCVIGPLDTHRRELIDYYSALDPALETDLARRRRARIGQFLMDLIPAETLIEEARENSGICETSYFIALKAQSQGHYETASEWYRLATETLLPNETCYSWAFDTLMNWSSLGHNLDEVAGKKMGLVLF